MQLTNETLLALLREPGHERGKAEDYLYTRFAYLIAEGASNYHLSRQDSFEAYVEALYTFFCHAATGRYDDQHAIKDYITRIFYHKCIVRVRQYTQGKHTDMIADLFEQLPGREQQLIAIQMQKERLDLLRLDLDRLNERHREILLMWEQGYSTRHIASAMGFPSATAANAGSFGSFEKLKALVMARKLIHERKL